ncbi:MAG: hypothetical protein JWS12_234 [Candidatus Saccharibacteria bacterium]|nr:hypothetical protein [Candidatus Saccharibacteria bacterium]
MAFVVGGHFYFAHACTLILGTSIINIMSEQNGSFILEAGVRDFFGPHELHVTADPITTDPQLFREVCGQLGVKAHIIYNETPQSESVPDYLTGSDYECTSAESLVELGRIASGLRSAGIEVVREKIETTPWHPLAPKSASDARRPGSYFESHFTLPDLPTTHGWKILKWRGNPLLISTTDNKRREGLLFATLRHYESTSDEFCQTIEKFHAALAEQIEVKYPTVEFAVYDSNPTHDKKWVDSYAALQS